MLQQPDPSLHWKWVSSLSLLCYGQMATHAGAGVLPWVDNIASRMACFYLCGGDVSPALVGWALGCVRAGGDGPWAPL